MRLYFDLDLRQLVTSPGVRQVVANVALTRGDALDLEVQFVRAGVVQDPDPDSLFFCVKQAGDFDGEPLVLTTDFVKTGSGTTAYWTCQPNLNTTQLDEALGVGEAVDIPTLTASGEIGFVIDDRQTTCRLFRCLIENDLFRGGEGTPTPSVPPYPAPSEIPTLIDGKLDPAQVPDEIDARISVLGGSTAALQSAGLGEFELAIDTTKRRPVYGNSAGGVTDPFAALGVVKPTDIFALRLSQNISRENWAKAAKAITVLDSGFSSVVRSTTGYARALRWDGNWAANSGSGTPGSNITVAFGTAPASPYNTRIPKFFAIFPTNSSGNISGNLTYLSCSSNQLTSLDVSGLTALGELSCSSNQLTSLDVSGLTALSTLSCFDNQLTSLDVSGLTALSQLDCYNNQLTSLDVSGLTALDTLYCYNNQLTSLDVSGLTALSQFACNHNQLTSLDVSGLTALNTLYCFNNQLTTVRAVGVAAHHGSSSYFPLSLSNNDLSASALNQFYTDLAPGAGWIGVGGNPGTSGDDPTIASAKGYTVVGS
jgi:hypothetical protein